MLIYYQLISMIVRLKFDGVIKFRFSSFACKSFLVKGKLKFNISIHLQTFNRNAEFCANLKNVFILFKFYFAYILVLWYLCNFFNHLSVSEIIVCHNN